MLWQLIQLDLIPNQVLRLSRHIIIIPPLVHQNFMPLKYTPAGWSLTNSIFPSVTMWSVYDSDMMVMMTIMMTCDKRSESSDGYYKEDVKEGGPLSTGSSNGGNSWTGCMNRPLHFNSCKNDRSVLETTVFKLFHSLYCLSLDLPHCLAACLMFSVKMILLKRFVRLLCGGYWPLCYPVLNSLPRCANWWRS